MSRRLFLIAAPSLLALVGVAKGQQRVYKVAWLAGSSRESMSFLRKILLDQLGQAGFVEGGNLQMVERYADGRLERLPTLARELGSLNPDVLLANGTQSAVAVRDATRGFPIVFAFVSDPVASGLVADLSHPGGRVTGFTNMNYELMGKRLGVLREAFPAVEKVAVFHDPQNKAEIPMLEFLRKGASALKIELAVMELARGDDFPKAFAALERRMPDALFILENASNVTNRQQIFDFAMRHKLPAIYGFESFVEAGGLMSYSAPQSDQFVGAARYVAKILRGVKVADLPVQLPSRFTLVVNLKTARASSIAIPQSVLLRADQVIE